MKQKSVYLLLVLVMAFSAFIASAQEEIIDYVSTDGDVTLAYPSGWLITEMAFPGFPKFYVVANSEAALENAINETSVSGDVNLWIALFLKNTLLTGGLDEGATPSELVYHVFFDFFGAGTEIEETNALIGEAQVVTLDNAQDAGVITFTSDVGDGFNVAYEIEDEVVAYAFSLVASGDLIDAVQGQFLDILASVTFSGTLEALALSALYTSEDELFSFSYPSNWVVESGEDPANPSATLANSPEALERLLIEQPFESGDEGISVMFFSAETFYTPIPSDLETIEANLQYIADFFAEIAASESESAEPVMVIGDVEGIELANGHAAATMPFSITGTADGIFVLVENPAGVLNFTFSAAAPDEFSESLQTTTLELVESIQFNGTLESLLSAVAAQ